MRSVRLPMLGLLALLALLLAPTFAFAQAEGDAAAAVLQWQERFNAGDPDGVAALYIDDLRWILTSGATLTSRAEIVAVVQSLLDTGFDAITIVVEDVLVLGEVAATSGTYVFTGPGLPDYPGNFTSTLVREGGVWRTAYHVSFVIPPPAEP